MSRQKQSSRHSKKRKLVSCFFGLHGSVCTFFKRIEILENESINELHKDDFKNIIEARTFADAEKMVYKFPRKQKENKYTNFFRNFKSFYARLQAYQESNLDVLANGFLNKCQIIEIKSWQIEQAITMFNSLNSTGMPLSDADIISAHLFSHAPNQEDFKEIWEPIIRQADELSQKKIVNIDSVLQQFMYINRAKERQYEEGQLTTPGVRKYYTVLYPELLKTPIDICENFKRILWIWDEIQEYPITKLLLKFNENFKLFLISYLFRVSKEEIWNACFGCSRFSKSGTLASPHAISRHSYLMRILN